MRISRRQLDYPGESKKSDYWNLFNIRMKGATPPERMKKTREYAALYFRHALGSEVSDIYARQWRITESNREPGSVADFSYRNIYATRFTENVLRKTQGQVIEDMVMWGMGIPETRRDLFADKLIIELACEAAGSMKSKLEIELEKKT